MDSKYVKIALWTPLGSLQRFPIPYLDLRGPLGGREGEGWEGRKGKADI